MHFHHAPALYTYVASSVPPFVVGTSTATLATIAYGNGIFLAGSAKSGTRATIQTSINGSSWGAIAYPHSVNVAGVVYSINYLSSTQLFYFYYSYTNHIYTTADGITFTEITGGAVPTYGGLISGKVMAISDDSVVMMRPSYTYNSTTATATGYADISTNGGVTWTQKIVSYSSMCSIATHNGTWIIVANTASGSQQGYPRAFVSTNNGTTWAAIANLPNANGTSYIGCSYELVAHHNNTWVTLGTRFITEVPTNYTRYFIAYSTDDGINWSFVETAYKATSVAYGDGVWCIATAVGKWLLSTDLITWIESPYSFVTNTGSNTAFGDGRFVTVLYLGTTSSYVLAVPQ